MPLSLALAERFIAAAKRTAQEQGLDMSFAVADSAGNLVALARMDNARWLTTGVAQSKAFTAATFRRTSREVAELAESRSQLFASVAEIIGRPLLLAGGGLPFTLNGEFLGASGGTENEDIECARAALDALGAA